MKLGAFGTALIATLVVSTACRAKDPPVEPLAISKETTWITEPLRSDGTPDYPAWLTRKYAAGVTSENNAAVVLGQLKMIGGDVLDPAPFPGAFVAQHGRALLAPWDEVDAPLIATWLRLNEANVASAEEIVRSRPR